METKNSVGSTPLHVAAYYGSRDMVNILLHSGARQNGKNKVSSLTDNKNNDAQLRMYLTAPARICDSL